MSMSHSKVSLTSLVAEYFIRGSFVFSCTLIYNLGPVPSKIAESISGRISAHSSLCFLLISKNDRLEAVEVGIGLFSGIATLVRQDTAVAYSIVGVHVAVPMNPVSDVRMIEHEIRQVGRIGSIQRVARMTFVQTLVGRSMM